MEVGKLSRRKNGTNRAAAALGINKYKIGVSKSGVIVSRPKNNRIYDWKYVWEIDSDKKGAKL